MVSRREEQQSLNKLRPSQRQNLFSFLCVRELSDWWSPGNPKQKHYFCIFLVRRSYAFIRFSKISLKPTRWTITLWIHVLSPNSYSAGHWAHRAGHQRSWSEDEPTPERLTLLHLNRLCGRLFLHTVITATVFIVQVCLISNTAFFLFLLIFLRNSLQCGQQFVVPRNLFWFTVCFTFRTWSIWTLRLKGKWEFSKQNDTIRVTTLWLS